MARSKTSPTAQQIFSNVQNFLIQIQTHCHSSTYASKYRTMVLSLIADSAMPTEIDYQQRIAAYDRLQLFNNASSI
jgi:hypothetical protein